MIDKDIPMLDASMENFAEHLEFNLWSTHSSSDTRNDRERPYNGQPWTDNGVRGQTEVKGVTMRDIKDCLIKAILICSMPDDEQDFVDHAIDKPGRNPLLSEKVDNGTWREQDVYKVNLNKCDPIAIAQNLTCEIEKMMGIFPNVPTLEETHL